MGSGPIICPIPIECRGGVLENFGMVLPINFSDVSNIIFNFFVLMNTNSMELKIVKVLGKKRLKEAKKDGWDIDMCLRCHHEIKIREENVFFSFPHKSYYIYCLDCWKHGIIK